MLDNLYTFSSVSKIHTVNTVEVVKGVLVLTFCDQRKVVLEGPNDMQWIIFWFELLHVYSVRKGRYWMVVGFRI